MNKKKSNFVTILVASMLAIIEVCLFKLVPVAFYILTGCLAMFGFVEAATAFSAWLAYSGEDKLDVPEVVPEDHELLSEDFEATYESIREEVSHV